MPVAAVSPSLPQSSPASSAYGVQRFTSAVIQEMPLAPARLMSAEAPSGAALQPSGSGTAALSGVIGAATVQQRLAELIKVPLSAQRATLGALTPASDHRTISPIIRRPCSPLQTRGSVQARPARAGGALTPTRPGAITPPPIRKELLTPPGGSSTPPAGIGNGAVSLLGGYGRDFGRPATPGASFVASGAQWGQAGSSVDLARGEPLLTAVASIRAPLGTPVTVAVANRDGTPQRASTVAPTAGVQRQTSQLGSTLFLARSSSCEASTFKAPVSGERDLCAEVGDLRRQLSQLKAAVDGDVLEAFRRLRQQQADLAARLEQLASGSIPGEVRLESPLSGGSTVSAMMAAQMKTEAVLQSLDARVDAALAEARTAAGLCGEDRRRVEEMHAVVAQLQAQSGGGSWAALNAEDKEAGAKAAMARLNDRVSAIDCQLAELRASQFQLAGVGVRRMPGQDGPSPWADVIHEPGAERLQVANAVATSQFQTVAAARSAPTTDEERKLRELFDRCDADGLGLVSKSEMIKLLRGHPEMARLCRPVQASLGQLGTKHAGADVFETVFQQIDAEDDRCITWNALREHFRLPGDVD